MPSNDASNEALCPVPDFTTGEHGSNLAEDRIMPLGRHDNAGSREPRSPCSSSVSGSMEDWQGSPSQGSRAAEDTWYCL